MTIFENGEPNFEPISIHFNKKNLKRRIDDILPTKSGSKFWVKFRPEWGEKEQAYDLVRFTKNSAEKLNTESYDSVSHDSLGQDKHFLYQNNIFLMKYKDRPIWEKKISVGDDQFKPQKFCYDSATDRFVVLGSNSIVKVYVGRTQRVISKLTTEKGIEVTSLSISKGGAYIALGYANGVLSTFNSDTGKLIWKGLVHLDEVNDIIAAPSNNNFLSIGDDGYLVEFTPFGDLLSELKILPAALNNQYNWSSLKKITRIWEEKFLLQGFENLVLIDMSENSTLKSLNMNIGNKKLQRSRSRFEPEKIFAELSKTGDAFVVSDGYSVFIGKLNNIDQTRNFKAAIYKFQNSAVWHSADAELTAFHFKNDDLSFQTNYKVFNHKIRKYIAFNELKEGDEIVKSLGNNNFVLVRNINKLKIIDLNRDQTLYQSDDVASFMTTGTKLLTLSADNDQLKIFDWISLNESTQSKNFWLFPRSTPNREMLSVGGLPIIEKDQKDKNYYLWDQNVSRTINKYSLPYGIEELFPKGNFLTWFNKHRSLVIKNANGAEYLIPREGDGITDFNISNWLDQAVAIVARESGNIEIWSIYRQEKLFEVKASMYPIESISTSSNTEKILIADSNGKFYIWTIPQERINKVDKKMLGLCFEKILSRKTDEWRECRCDDKLTTLFNIKIK